MPRNVFTLLELVVVMAIIALTTSLAVATFRGESPTQQLANAALGFEAFCARVRFQSLENGADRIVAFNPEKRMFLLENPDAEEEDAKLEKLEWPLPEGFEFDAEELLADAYGKESVAVIRFFPDGAASGRDKLTFRYKNLQAGFSTSPLTGALIRLKEEELR